MVAVAAGQRQYPLVALPRHGAAHLSGVAEATMDAASSSRPRRASFMALQQGGEGPGAPGPSLPCCSAITSR